jgi:pantetheine-phosphate adenylyltransferase
MSQSPRVAIFPGSFDPLTLGHEDVARRALRIADRLLVAVAHDPSREKQGLFSIPERLAIIREVFAEEAAIEAVEFTGLLVEFARQQKASLLIRGLRGVADFEYELRMALFNRQLHPDLETIFLTPNAERSFLSSTLIRQVASLGGDVSPFVSETVRRRLEERIASD